MIRGTNCEKQIQSSLRIHKFKFRFNLDDKMTHGLSWVIRGTNCEKQIQSSLRIHKFKFKFNLDDKMTHDLSWMIRGTNCEKQIQSSLRIHKFKFKFNLGFLLTVSKPLTCSQSFCHAQNPSAVGSSFRSDSSREITFSRLLINQPYIIIRTH